MRRYVKLLRNRPFAALWLGSTVSAIGDALTWVALVWLVIEPGITPTVLAMTIVMAVPGFWGLVTPALEDERTRMSAARSIEG